MFRNILMSIIAAGIFYSCAEQTVPIKYIKNGNKFSCRAFAFQPGDTVLNCYDALGNKILTDTFLKGELDNVSTMEHPSGKVKLIGEYTKGYKIGVWNEFYENGTLKKYNYFDTSTFENTYSKIYNANGELDSLIYSIDISIKNTNKPTKGDTISFLVELSYSEFEDGSIVVIFLDEDRSDTLYAERLSLPYKKVASQSGLNVLKGTLFEIHGNNEYGGERYFEYKYEVE